MRGGVIAATGALVLLTAGVAPALAASSSSHDVSRTVTNRVMAPIEATSTTSSSSQHRRQPTNAATYEAVAGNFGTNSAAAKRESELAKKGYSGYVTETERHYFQVEKTFTQPSDAKAEVAKLRAAGVRFAWVETDRRAES